MIIAWLIIQTLENFHDYATLRKPINLGCFNKIATKKLQLITKKQLRQKLNRTTFY